MKNVLGRLRRRSERDVKGAILDYLNRLPGTVAYKLQVGRFQRGGRWIHVGIPGMSDIGGYLGRELTGCARPIPLYIETKAMDGRHRPEQEEFIRARRADGCLATFARSIEDVWAYLRRNGIEVQQP